MDLGEENGNTIRKNLADLFRWRVAESGEDVAHKFIDKETTYAELDSYANKVAQGLISLDCKPDSRVAFLKTLIYFLNSYTEPLNLILLLLE